LGASDADVARKPMERSPAWHLASTSMQTRNDTTVEAAALASPPQESALLQRHEALSELAESAVNREASQAAEQAIRPAKQGVNST
jgi:hypothetical protein